MSLRTITEQAELELAPRAPRPDIVHIWFDGDTVRSERVPMTNAPKGWGWHSVAELSFIAAFILFVVLV